MHKLYENAAEELHIIADHGLNAGNLDMAYKLSEIAKNALKINKMTGESMDGTMINEQNVQELRQGLCDMMAGISVFVKSAIDHTDDMEGKDIIRRYIYDMTKF